jgi:hypothetical protein
MRKTEKIGERVHGGSTRMKRKRDCAQETLQGIIRETS